VAGFLKTWLDPNGAGKWGIVPIPETPGLNWGGSNLAIPEQSKHKEEAWKFIEFALARKTSQIAIYKAVDFFPALTTAWNDPIFYEPDPYFGGQKQRLLFINIAKQTPIPVVNPNDPMAESILMQHVANCLDQGIDPAKALKDAADEIREKAGIK
jgi:multiple sugar transport system substrate-binding protein